MMTLKTASTTILITAMALIPACGPSDENAEPEELEPIAAEPLSLEPRFKVETEIDPGVRVDPPETPPALRWDFSEVKTIAYELFQAYETSTAIEIPPELMGELPPNAKSEATLIVRSEGDGTAVVEIHDASVYLGDEEQPTERQPGLVATIGRMDESGQVQPSELQNGHSGSGHAEQFLSLLISLPNEPLRPGESLEDTLELPIPQELPGFELSLRREITLLGYEMRNGERCAKLEVALTPEDADLPEGVSPGIQFGFDGKSVVLFSIESRTFASAEMTIAMGFAGIMQVDMMMKMERKSGDSEDTP